MDKARNEFIDLLARYRSLTMHDITVVFDGYHQGGGIEHTTILSGVKVIYSRLRERADDVIKRIISKDRKEWIVVTSDRSIMSHAWSVNSIPVPSNRFHQIVTEATGKTDYVNEADDSGKDDAGRLADLNAEGDGESSRYRKGNPHMLSKKEKAVKKALGKL